MEKDVLTWGYVHLIVDIQALMLSLSYAKLSTQENSEPTGKYRLEVGVYRWAADHVIGLSYMLWSWNLSIGQMDLDSGSIGEEKQIKVKYSIFLWSWIESQIDLSSLNTLYW